MKIRLIIISCLIIFLGQISFSIFFSNTIATYNFQINQKNKLYHQLLLKNSSLKNYLYSLISIDNIFKDDNSSFPINQSFP